MSARTVRVLAAMLVAVVVVWLRFTIVFPWVDREYLNNPLLGLWLTGAG